MLEKATAPLICLSGEGRGMGVAFHNLAALLSDRNTLMKAAVELALLWIQLQCFSS